MLTPRLLAFFLISAAAAAQDVSKDWAMEPLEAARALPALAAIAETDPGGTLLVTRGDEVLHVQAFGLASLSCSMPCGKETLYRYDGAARTAIQILALEMAEAGAVDLDTRISALLPALGRVPGDYSLGDLVQGRAKLQDLDALVHFRQLSERGRISRKEAIEILGQTRTLADYASRETNSHVVAAALEAAAQEELGVLLQTHVFGPAGMDSAVHARNHRQIVPGGAEPATWSQARGRWEARGSDPLTNEDGSLWLTAKDALLFGRHFMDHSGVPMADSGVLARGKDEDDALSPSGVMTVHFPERDLFITWVSGANLHTRSSIPSEVGLYMLGRSSETQNSLLGIGGGAGGRRNSTKVDYQGTLETGSFALSEIGQHLVLSRDKRGRHFVSTVGVPHARLELLPMKPGAKTVTARAESSHVVTDRLSFAELARLSDDERREQGYDRSGVRRSMTRPSVVSIEFELVEGGAARPISVDLDRFLPARLSLDNLQIERASSLSAR